MMKTLFSIPLFLSLMFTLVGCGGGSSVELPEEVITEDTYAVQWTNFKALSPEDGVKMLQGIANDLDDEQGKERLFFSAEADTVDLVYRERWEAFTDAGCQGLLKVYYVTEDDGKVSFETHTFLKAKSGKDTDEILEALKEFIDDDMGAAWRKDDKDLELEEVNDDGWYWITRSGSTKGMPDQPEDGDEEAYDIFDDLMDESEGAPVVYAYRMTEPISDAIEEALDKGEDSLSEDDKALLNASKDVESFVLAAAPGSSAKTHALINFKEKETAKEYAEKYNEEQRKSKARAKKGLMRSDNPPHPDLIDRLVENSFCKASGKSVTMERDIDTIQTTLLLTALDGKGGDMTSPAMLIHLDRNMALPNYLQVPGVMQAFNLKFDEGILPKSGR